MTNVLRAVSVRRSAAGGGGRGAFGMIGIIAVAALCFSGSSALADPPEMPTIVLESNVGECSPNMTETITPLLNTLADYGFVVKPATIASLLGEQAPRPGILDKGKTAKEITQQIEAGLEAFRTGRYEDAEGELQTAVRLIKRNPGVWVLDGANTALTFTAVVRLAVAQKVNNHSDEAYETMMDLLRMSSVPVTKTKFGPRAEDLYNGAQKQARPLGRGSLVVNVTDPSAVIFLEGQFRGIGKVAVGDLIPGPRHLFVQVGSLGRQYELAVLPDSQRAIDIDWEIDSALTVDDPCAGFAFANPADRQKEGVYARQLARRWGSKKVIVVGLGRLEGNLEVLGTVYPADGSPARRASVPASEGEAGMRSLARFLVDGTRSNHLNVIEGGPGAYPSMSAQASGRGLSLTSKIVLGSGAVAFAAGVGAYRLSGVDGRSSAVYAVVASSPVLGAGIYLGLRDLTSAPPVASALLGGSAASLVAGTFLYVTDEDPDGARRTYRDSATIGLIVGGTGVALAGAGAWLWYRERAHRSEPASSATAMSQRASALAPIVSVGPSNVTLGCLGSF